MRAKGIIRLAEMGEGETIVHLVGRRWELKSRAAWAPGDESRMAAVAKPGTEPGGRTTLVGQPVLA